MMFVQPKCRAKTHYRNAFEGAMPRALKGQLRRGNAPRAMTYIVFLHEVSWFLEQETRPELWQTQARKRARLERRLRAKRHRQTVWTLEHVTVKRLRDEAWLWKSPVEAR